MRVATGGPNLMPSLLSFCAERFSRLGDDLNIISITGWVFGGDVLLLEERSHKESYE